MFMEIAGEVGVEKKIQGFNNGRQARSEKDGHDAREEDCQTKMQIVQPERALPGVVPEIRCDHQDGNETSEEKEQIAVKDLDKITKSARQNRSGKGNENTCDAGQLAAFGKEMGSACGNEGCGGPGDHVAVVVPAAAYGNEIDIGTEQNGQHCRNGKAQENRGNVGYQIFKPRCQSHG